MRLKLLERFKISAPARKVVLLPDAHFFCRAVPVSESASPAEAAAQIELALEALAPFPLAHMYHGHFWRPGAKNAFVFAAYRKRFTSEQVESWSDAEAVLPTFATLLATPIARPTTLLLGSEKGLTAVNWDDGNDAPVSVVARELPPEPTETDRTALREAVLVGSGRTRTLVEPTTAPVLDNTTPGDEFVYRNDVMSATFTREQIDMLDVRDKDELSSRRRARVRDLLLWRVLLGSAAIIVLTLSLEAALVGGRLWQKARTIRVDMQEPFVTKIRQAQNLATRIDELSTKRMRPFEMISMVAEKKPSSVTFISTSVANPNLFALDIEAQAANPDDFNAFRSALSSMPSCENVEVKENRFQNGLTTFRVIVTFKPDAFKAAQQS
jgi:hypothetical protein